jgi:hypothetical protein
MASRSVDPRLHLVLFPFEEPDCGSGHALEQQVAANDVPRLHADEKLPPLDARPPGTLPIPPLQCGIPRHEDAT